MSKFWVNGTGNSNDPTNHWATTDGGAPGAGNAPTAADDIFITALSGAGTLTINAALAGRSFQSAGSSIATLVHGSGVTVTLGDATAGASNIALDLSGFTTYTKNSTTTSAITFVSTSATQQTVNYNGKGWANLTFNGAGSSYKMLTSGSTAGSTTQTFSHNQGTMDLNGITMSVGVFTGSFANNRSISINGAAITCTGTGNVFNYNSGTSQLTVASSNGSLTLSGATPSIFFGGKNWGSLDVTHSGSGAMVITPSSTAAETATIRDFTKTAGALSFGTAVTAHLTMRTWTITGTLAVSLRAAATYTATALNVTGVVGAPATFNSATGNSQATIALGATGTATLSDVTFTDIAVTGTNAPVSGTRLGNGGDNSGITFSSKSVYWVGNGGNTSDSTNHVATSSGGSGAAINYPLPQDTLYFDANSFSSGSQTVLCDYSILSAMDWSAVTNSPTLDINLGVTCYGNHVYGPMTVDSSSGVKLMFFAIRSAATLTQNGATFTANASVLTGAAGNSLTLGSNFVSSGPVTIGSTLGTFNANNFNLSCSAFSATGTSGTVTMGSGIWTMTSTGTIWSVVAGTTLNANTSTIVISDTSASAKTFVGAGKTYKNLSITGGGAGTVTFTGANTFATLPQITGGMKSIVWPGSTTTTFTAGGNFGNTTNVITMTASAGSATLAFGTQVVADYLNLTNIIAATTTPAYAGANSTDGAGNTNWVFSGLPVPSTGSTLLMMNV